MSNPDMNALETIIDRSTLHHVVETLADICREKAEHLRANWQDEAAARTWEKAALKLDGAAMCNWIRAI